MLSVILSIFILILKILGILLLILLGILLLILLVPISYKMEMDDPEGESFQAQAMVSWFFYLLRVCAEYHQKKGLRYEVKIFGKLLFGSDPDPGKKNGDGQSSDKKKKGDSTESLPKKTEAEEMEFEEAEAEETESEEAEAEEMESEEAEAAETESEKTEADQLESGEMESEISGSGKLQTPHTDSAVPKDEGETSQAMNPENETPDSETEGSGKVHKKKAGGATHSSKQGSAMEQKESRLDRFLSGMEEKKAQAEKLYAQAEEYQVLLLLDIAGKTLMRLFRHIRPRHVSGWVRYGFDDPSLTGRITAFLATLYPIYGRSCSVEADFSRSCFAGQIRCKGHIQLGYLLWLVISLLLKKEIRKLIGLLFRS